MADNTIIQSSIIKECGFYFIYFCGIERVLWCSLYCCCLTCRCLVTRLWYRSPFYFLPTASSYLVFGWPPTIIEKNSWDARSILVFVFLTTGANFRLCLSNNNVHVAWTLLQPISLPYPHQTMLRGPTRKMTMWLLSTLYRGRGGQIQLLPLNYPNTFFNDCLSCLVSWPGCCILFFVFLKLTLEFSWNFSCLQPTLYPFIYKNKNGAFMFVF